MSAKEIGFSAKDLGDESDKQREGMIIQFNSQQPTGN